VVAAAIISAIIALGWSSSPAIPATGSIDNVSQDMKTKVDSYIKTATYHTITNAMTPAVVSDPKNGRHIYTVYSSEAKMRGQPLLPATLRRRRRQDVFSDPVRVNDKEGEGGNSGGLRRETAKHALRCLIGCNNIGEGIGGAAIGFLLGWDIISTLVLAVGLAFAVGYAFTIIPILKTMPLRQAARVTLVGDTASISAMEI
jgi:hypothetical protein